MFSVLVNLSIKLFIRTSSISAGKISKLKKVRKRHTHKLNVKVIRKEKKRQKVGQKHPKNVSPHSSLIHDEFQTQSAYPWHCHKNRLIKTNQIIPHNLYVSFKLTSLYQSLRLIMVYPNP